MHIIDTGDFVLGCGFSVTALYYLLGLFSNAPWLHTDGRRKDGHWVVVPNALRVRFARFLIWTGLGLHDFDGAFHKDVYGRDGIFLLVMLVCILLFLRLSFREEKKNRKAT